MGIVLQKAEEKLSSVFEKLDEIKDYNQEKVLKAFQDNKIGEEHFAYVSGYGHDDHGRQALDAVYAQ
ncbi:MAG: methionine gamma-lyase family protein, partial [Candidatus Gastranaerophilaceae bacterium]